MSIYTGAFFGGIDGLLYLDKEVQAAPEFYPDILLRKLTVGHTQVVQGMEITIQTMVRHYS